VHPSSVENGPVRKAPVALQLWTVREAAEHAHWWIVEQDFCAGPAWESARRSLENLRAMGLA
jgi:hypothetical protein